MMRSTFRRVSLALALFAMALPATAAAQVIQRPPRSTGGLFGGADQPVDPNRTRSTLSATISALGGWDDDLLTAGEAVGTDPNARRSGYLGVGTASMRFWRGRAARSFELAGRTHLTAYTDIGVDPLVGGDASVSGQVRVGRRSQLSGALRGGYAPSLTLAAFGPVQAQIDSGVIADADPTRAVAELRSRTGEASVALRQDWTNRQWTQVDADISDRRFMGDTAIVSLYENSRGHSASLQHQWSVSRAVWLTGGYRYSDYRLREADGFERPTDTHGADAGVTVRRQLTRTRSIELGARGGATHVDAVSSVTRAPYDYVAPSGSGSVRLDLGRTWGLSADYRRDVSILEGLALDTFLTDAATLTIGGGLTDRLALAVSGALSEGEAQGSDRGNFESRIAAAQLQYAVTRLWSIVSSYAYYEHRLRELSAVPEGFPRRVERNSVRVGVSMNLPLYGNFSPNQTGGGN